MINISHNHNRKGRATLCWPFLLCLILAAVVTSCRDRQQGEVSASVSAEDSAALLQPSQIDSLPPAPFIIDAHMQARHIPSQMDADTALLGGSALAGTTSRSRLQHYQSQGQGSQWSILRSVPQEWSLVVCGRLRARTIRQMKGLTIAVARYDASQVLCRQILAEQIDPSSAFFPQINDLSIRLRMLDGGQIDAAMLTQPYADEARRHGHRILRTLTDTTQTVLVANPEADSLLRRQLSLLKLYGKLS